MKHKASWIAGLFLAGGVVLLALAVRGREKPEEEVSKMQPQATPVAATWTETAAKAVTTPPPSASSVTGNRQDGTQTVTYEDETTTVTSMAENLTREEASKDRPTAPPETRDDLTDPDRVPSYEPEDGSERGDGGNNGGDNGASSGGNSGSSGDNGGDNNGNNGSPNGNGGAPGGNDGNGNGGSSGGNGGGNGTSGGNPGQVHDPVFGWITTGSTRQDVVDNGGDVNKQIGTMGGN